MANQFPFPPAAGESTPNTVATNAAIPETPSVEVTEKKTRKKQAPGERKTPATPLTVEQANEIVSLVTTMSYSDIATKLGVTKFQVNRVLMDTKKKLRASVEAIVDETERAQTSAKVENYIKTKLSRPEDTRPGAGGAREGKVDKALNDIVGDILNSLG